MNTSRCVRVIALIVLLTIATFATTASAGDTVTFTATQTIPVPPASSFSGSTGGDGWAVALTPTSVYNVFHHDYRLNVACHLQVGAGKCWDSDFKTITQPNGDGHYDFQSSGHPGLWLDQPTGHLYVYATRSDSTGGVVCIDTVTAASTPNPFCGFTPLTASGESPAGSYSVISTPAVVGSHWFAFNYVNGTGVGGSQGVGAQNKLLCFDLNTFKACSGQPFTVDLGSSNDVTVTAGTPSPIVAAIGDQVIVPINVGHHELACFDGTRLADLANCPGSWPASIPTDYIGRNGAPFPMLNASGGFVGVCLPSSGIPCYTLAGALVGETERPRHIAEVIVPSTNWNGPALVIGPRVYVPRWNNEVDCYDYAASAGCENFPKFVSGLSGLYTVNADPQRPECIWANADNRQIQNFDAFTGEACGEGPIRVLASRSVVSTPLCTPGAYTTLQVTSPARSAYTSGTVAFRDPSNNPISDIPDLPIDSKGAVNLSGLALNTSSGLPQFLITLNSEGGRPASVVVQLTWTGTYDPSCATKPGTVVANAPTATTPPKTDIRVAVTPPTLGRPGETMTFRANVSNGGPDAATGVLLRTPVPANATLVSASSTVGTGCTLGLEATCFIGTLGSGSSAVVTMVFRTGQVGPFTIAPAAEGDYDTNQANNRSSATTTVVSPNAPPPPPPASSQPGTFNAISTGTVTVNGVVRSADQLFQLNSGDVVDATNGTITFTGSDGSFLSISASQFTARRTSSRAARSATGDVPAQFRVTQPATTGEITTLTLVGGDFASCAKSRSLSATDKRPVRALWGSGKGKFRTQARFSAATVRGTVWLTQDRCDGSLTSVVEGVVDVFDQSLGKTVSVSPGQSYLALPKKAAFKPPTVKSSSAQIAKSIRQTGLVWSGRRFTSRVQFEEWLRARGKTWAQFKQRYPVQAAALAARR